MLLWPWDSPGRNTGVGCHALLPGTFPAQGSHPQLLCLLHWQAGSLPLVPPGEPNSTLHGFISPNHLINPMMLPGYFHDAHFIEEKLRLWDLQCLNQGMCLVQGRAWTGPSCAWLRFCFDMGVWESCCLVCAQFTDEETGWEHQQGAHSEREWFWLTEKGS